MKNASKIEITAVAQGSQALAAVMVNDLLVGFNGKLFHEMGVPVYTSTFRLILMRLKSLGRPVSFIFERSINNTQVRAVSQPTARVPLMQLNAESHQLNRRKEVHIASSDVSPVVAPNANSLSLQPAVASANSTSLAVKNPYLKSKTATTTTS